MDKTALKNLCRKILADYFQIDDHEELGKSFIMDHEEINNISSAITDAIQKVTIMIKINYDDDKLWCIDSKQRINIGEKYVIIKEDVLGEIITKTYKLENAPIDFEETDDVWISDKN